MLKKLVIVSVVVAGGIGLLFGTSALSYMRMGVASVRQGIKDSIPVEVEIKRAKEMITGLKPEIAENLRVIAREEVEVTRLSDEIEKKHLALDKSKRDILKLKDDLQSGQSHFVYAKKQYTSNEVKDDLTNKFKSFQTQEATVANLEKVLSARQKRLSATRQKLDSMLAAKRQLEVEVESLQARYRVLEVAETTTKIALNDSQLSKTRELLDEIGSRIDVAEKIVHSEGTVVEGIQIDDTPSVDLVDQITDYFGAQRAEVEKLVNK